MQGERTPAEAAGEIYFANDKQLSLGALSHQSRAEIDDIVDAWLAHATDAATVTAHGFIATHTLGSSPSAPPGRVQALQLLRTGFIVDERLGLQP